MSLLNQAAGSAPAAPALPNSNMINAGFHAARAAIEAYSEIDSSMVPDEALMTVVTDVLQAAEKVRPKVTPPAPLAE